MKTLTQHDQLLVKPYIDAKIKRVMEKIASVETSPTANSYSEGKYLIYNDIVYEVTTAISVGDTLVIYPATGYNIKVADDIMTMIETLRTENQTLTNQVNTKASQTALNNVANKVSNSGDAYSPSKAYKVGEYVIHDDVLYKCTTACSAAAWSVNQSCFTPDTLSNAVTSLNTDLSMFKTFPASAVTAIASDGSQFTPSTSTVTWKWCTGSNGQVYLCAYVDGTFVEALHGFLQFESTNKKAVGHD